MPTVKSLDDLKSIKERGAAEAPDQDGQRASAGDRGDGHLRHRRRGARHDEGHPRNDRNRQLQGIVVTQTGCIGLCECEPIVQVTLGDQPKVTYGKVTPDRAQQILKEHVVGGQVVKNLVVPA